MRETMNGYERHTEAIKLRLAPNDAARLREQVRLKGFVTISGFVVALLDAHGSTIAAPREMGAHLGDLAILANSISGLTGALKRSRAELAQVGRLLKAQFVEAECSAIAMRPQLNAAIDRVWKAASGVEAAGEKCARGLEPLEATIAASIERLADS